MVFSSSVFLFAFLPVVLLVYYGIFSFSRTVQNIFLCIVSLFFYAWGEPWFVFAMIGSILFNYAMGLWVSKNMENKSKKRLIHFITTFINLALLFVFKYLMFVVKTWDSWFGSESNIPTIVLPIGISFFTFQAMSYVFDVSRGHGQAQKNPLNVALYISFFPQLIAGPIVRYETVAEQINHRKENLTDFCDGVVRFIIGLAKKVLIANQLALTADVAFKNNMDGSLSVSMAWLGILAYTLQIYYDFSGYSDMAVGLGRMFGFHFVENFNYPYIATSITAFWRRWHISLSTWFRDYVYFPLGGSRVNSKVRLIFNLFVVWTLTGIWHGAYWTFIAWGLMFFVLIAVEKLTGYPDKFKYLSPLKWLITMLIVILGWVLFRSNTMTEAWQYINVMFGAQGIGFTDAAFTRYLSSSWMLLLAGGVCAVPWVSLFRKKFEKNNFVLDIVTAVVLIVLFVGALSYIIQGAYDPFIYFNF
ncbi:MAG TPA: membrane-bound O-acyltransferase family protein [Clostridiales bacterium]|nr:membrane-bound O-acyltransferase family protein [Clostridiales bacterium]